MKANINSNVVYSSDNGEITLKFSVFVELLSFIDDLYILSLIFTRDNIYYQATTGSVILT